MKSFLRDCFFVVVAYVVFVTCVIYEPNFSAVGKDWAVIECSGSFDGFYEEYAYVTDHVQRSI